MGRAAERDKYKTAKQKKKLMQQRERRERPRERRGERGGTGLLCVALFLRFEL